MRGLAMPSGKVKWFNAKKGYGFITDDETQKDIFLHVSALENSKLRVLKEDQKIVFDIKEELKEKKRLRLERKKRLKKLLYRQIEFLMITTIKINWRFLLK